MGARIFVSRVLEAGAVFDLPEALAKGGDPTLERAVSWLLEELKTAGAREPDAPEPPNLAP